MALADYNHVRTAVFVKIYVDEYYQTGTGFLSPEYLLFSDHFTDFTLFPGETYTALGNLMGITGSSSELTPTAQTISITLSGIPNASIKEIERSKIKSAPVEIYRAFFTQSGEFIDDGTTTNPIGRFFGFVNNYSLSEEWDTLRRLSTNTISLECTSNVEILSKKRAGRKTNGNSMRRWYPSDASFDRVQALANVDVNFGGAK